MLAVTLALSLLAAESSAPLSTQEQQRVDALTNDLNSPFCPGRTLATCPSPKAAEWRNDIRDWVQEGVAAPEIQDRLQSRVPDFRMSARPPGAWSTLVPGLVLAFVTLGFLAVALKLRPRPKARDRDGAESAHQTSARPDDSDARGELKRQLAELD